MPHSVATNAEVREELLHIHHTPQSFVRLVTDAVFHEDYAAITELVDALTTLRAKLARDTDNAKYLSSPSPVEQTYQLQLPQLRVKMKRMTARRVRTSMQIFHSTDQPTTLRYYALQSLIAAQHELKGNSKASQLVQSVRSSASLPWGKTSRFTFNLLIDAMREEFLSPESQAEARRLASAMFRNCTPQEDLDFNLETERSRHLSDTDESVIERLFDRLYGDGTYAELTMMA